MIIIGFDVTGLIPKVRNPDQLVVTFECKSDIFSDGVKIFKANLKPGTVVCIENVLVKNEDGSLVKVPGTGKLILE